ncbi:biliverdin-producing heme oxygenase [Dactylosporangium roseum]|uniref:Biliverdin-producing heme oxygenase n=1 Tax=Dactylosporangium roseum TaxID=47989 RepID=A0ABY5ZDT0_9ACTN|nr:biliverdin-producing heme oxygenase [Dactylosporangium roseum]UWZ39103.1 biliverdin-producing heme oxygenase [Dactylosporangium roseum]
MTSVSEGTTSERFTAALRSTTWDDHEKAERTAYMEALLGGKLSVPGYVDLVAQHYFAYVVLEDAAEAMRDDPIGSKFVFDSLLRVRALEEDLEHLLGADWRDKVRPSESTKEYCDRMRAVCFDWAGGYIAHSYTRYLGDLSGGQVIRAALERAHPQELADGKGVAFYYFPQISDFKAFKVEYRDRLDNAPWDEAEQQRVINEALVAYQLNTKVLAELGHDLPRYLIA